MKHQKETRFGFQKPRELSIINISSSQLPHLETWHERARARFLSPKKDIILATPSFVAKD